MQTKVIRIVTLFILLSVSCINVFAKSFIKNGIYYAGNDDTKEASVVQVNNMIIEGNTDGVIRKIKITDRNINNLLFVGRIDLSKK